MKRRQLFEPFLLLLLATTAASAAVQYPVDASWFANRWTLEDWLQGLQLFQAQGGSAVWQRGANFKWRPAGAAELQNDPDFIWCWALEDCLNGVVADVKAAGLVLENWFTYANDERYDAASMLRCPGLDIRIDSSRVYHRIVVPHDSFDSSWNCSFVAGQKVDVIFTLFNGIDPHELLLEAADKLGMDVYLPQPATPDVLAQRPAFFEFTRRVMASYDARFGKRASYKGVYQTNEAWLGMHDWKGVVEANQILAGLTHAQGKLFVASPYVDVFKSQVKGTTVADHKTGFKTLARSGADVIAVQEGRGCAKGCYWSEFQANTSVASVDPALDLITHYLDKKLKPAATFAETFESSNQMLFRAFEEAVEELKAEGVKTELWLNLEAFEYLRRESRLCLPVDVGGNGMAELLERTSKHRIDWGLSVAGSRVTRMISFAFDYDYTCVPNEGYEMSLTDEIKADWDRPIVAYFDRSTGDVRGFNIATAGTQFSFNCSSGIKTTLVATKIDPSYGKTHNRSPLLQQAIVNWAGRCSSDAWICLTATNPAGKTAFHPYCVDLGVSP